jgi:endonuclease G
MPAKRNHIFNSLIILFLVFLVSGCATVQRPSRTSFSSQRYGEHILYGYPGTKGTLLYRKGYVLGHDNSKKVASWVSYHLIDIYLVKNVPRSDDFRPDPDLPKGQRSELSDYRNSGYDKGHLAPAEDMRRDRETESETFLLSNIAPQVGIGFNRAVWKELESKVRIWAKDRRNIYVITGPIYDGLDQKTIGPNKVVVPTHFYKIVISSTKTGQGLDAIAFIIPNKENPNGILSQFITTIDEIENETGLDFLRELDDTLEETIESRKAEMW